MAHGYAAEAGRSYRIDDEGDREQMANFVAEIIEEVRYVDGINTHTVLAIKGVQGSPTEKNETILPTIEVAATEFPSMSWVMPNWGVKAVISPGQGVKDDLRAMIQLRSKPTVRFVYQHMGWTELDDGGGGKQQAYIHAGGAVTWRGNDDKVSVRLPHELRLYDLTTKISAKRGMEAILDLTNLTERSIVWPLIAGTLAPIFGPVDFALHVTGRTGTFKSELMSLVQSFYGPAMDARHLPGSWSSTPNALEAQAFCAKNAAFVVDDFVPTGTSWQVRSYQQTADKIVRSQGNQSGRARLTDVSNLQTTMYPRGIILSTGEDTPEGHSVRARMLILEMSPGTIQPQSLSAAQAQRSCFVGGVIGLIQAQCKKKTDILPRAHTLRNKYIKIGHTRTPSMLGHLIAVAEQVIAFAVSVQAIKPEQGPALCREAEKAIIEAGERQAVYLEDADPVELFCGAIRQAFATGAGHLRTLNGGIPVQAESLGWTREELEGELPRYRSKGACIGWIKWDDDELFLEMNNGFAMIRKLLGNEVSLTKQTLFKRLKDAGVLSRVDDARQRNTVRVTAENHPRQVVAMVASSVLESQEAVNEVPE